MTLLSLQLAGERRVRGAVERSYRLHEASASIGVEEAAAMSVEQHRRGFLSFVASLLAGYDRYLDGGDVDLGRDLVGYRQAALYLSDDELRSLIDDLRAVIHPRLALPPGEGRRRRILKTVVMPGDIPGPPAE